MDEPVTLVVDSILPSLTQIFAAQMTWVGTLMNTITNNPILLFAVVGSFALVAVGIVRRLLQL